MKYYTEILHPTSNKVLWHYYLEAPLEEEAKKFATNQFIKEQSEGLIIDLGGLFLVTAEKIEEWPTA